MSKYSKKNLKNKKLQERKVIRKIFYILKKKSFFVFNKKKKENKTND